MREGRPVSAETERMPSGHEGKRAGRRGTAPGGGSGGEAAHRAPG